MESQVGYERFFEPDDIFFSTTDPKGVILRTNRTFDTLSRYTRERLISAPHNIIRHLDMPAGVRVPAPPPVSGPVTQILTIVGHIEKDTNLLVFELEEYLRLLTSLASTKDVLLDVADRTEAFGEVVGGRALNIMDKADALASQVIDLSRATAPALRALPDRMDALRQSVLDLRFSVALMRLLTLMVGRFARSVLDGSEEDPAGSIRDLCGALEDGFSGLGPLCAEVEEGVASLDAELGRITPSLDRMVRRLSRWVDRYSGRGASATIARATALVERGTPEVRGMAALAAECRGLHLPFDDAVIRRRLRTLQSALAEIG